MRRVGVRPVGDLRLEKSKTVIHLRCGHRTGSFIQVRIGCLMPDEFSENTVADTIIWVTAAAN